MISRIQWLAGLAAVCGTSVMCAALANVYETDGPSTAPQQEEAPAPSRKALSMTTSYSHKIVSSDEPMTVFARYEITAPAARTTFAQPLDVVLVVDTSGSMSGDKIASARQAGRKLIDRVPPGTRIGLVTFDNAARVRAELLDVATDRAPLERAIQALEASGGTNLQGGIEMAHAMLQDGGRPDVLRRMFIVSDGHPTFGATSPEQLGAHARKVAMTGIGVTTLGVGLDFNEDVLGQMAIQGEGRFHFIDREGLAEALQEEVDGLRSAIATEVSLELRTGAGVSVEEVYGFPMTRVEGGGDVSIDTMFAESSRDVLVRLRVDPQTFEQGRLVRSRLVYRALEEASRQELVIDQHTRPHPGSITTRYQNASVLLRARVVLSERAVDHANQSWLKYDRRGAEAVLKAAIEANDAHQLDFEPTPELARANQRMRELLERIGSQKPDSIPSRRYRKQKKMNSIEIIRGDR